MYRVELKETLQPFTEGFGLGFLMYRVELKVIFGRLLFIGMNAKRFLMYRVELKEIHSSEVVG